MSDLKIEKGALEEKLKKGAYALMRVGSSIRTELFLTEAYRAGALNKRRKKIKKKR